MKVIARKNLPGWWPINHTILLLLIIDRYRPAQWILTLIVVWLVLIWIGTAVKVFNSEEVDVIK